MIRDYQAIQCSWFLKGKQRIIPTYGRHQGAKLLGTLNYETENYDAAVFLAFLKQVLWKYPSGKIVMILDNARIHHAKLIQPFLEENRHRLELVFLPPYSPELNLVEGLWKWLKETLLIMAFTPRYKKLKPTFENSLQTSIQIPLTLSIDCVFRCNY